MRRVCEAVVPVAPAAAVAAARLGDDEHRLAAAWAAPHAERRARRRTPPYADVAAALLERLGPLGARRALRLVRWRGGGAPAWSSRARSSGTRVWGSCRS